LDELRKSLRPFGLRHILITGLPLPQDEPWHREILYDGWPVEWLEHYVASAHFPHDPCAARSRFGTRPFLWCDLSRESMSARERRVMDEATEFGLKNGLCVPIRLPFHVPAVITAAGDHVELGSEALPILEIVCLQASRAMVGLQADNEPVFRLTDREREVMEWITAGKAAEDVACILGISRYTVERHLMNVREKLGATNTVHAVVKAIRRGEIHP
jgi:LuxR family quorum sensing-dependent transcriptional regulator